MKKLIAIITLLVLTVCVVCSCKSEDKSTSKTEQSSNSISVQNSESTQQTSSNSTINASSNQSSSGSTSVKPEVKGLSVESVKTDGNNKVIVTLNQKVSDFKQGDLKLYAQSSEWYSMDKGGVLVDRVNVTDTQVDNSGAKTVVTYTISNALNGIYLADNFFQDPSISSNDVDKIVTQADNAMTWQIPELGGWDKPSSKCDHFNTPRGSDKYNKSSGWTPKDKSQYGGYLGTIDNEGTYSHMQVIAKAYALTGKQKYKDSFIKGVGFLKKLQTSTGGFTQVYPARGNYSDYVTLNDNAMANVMIMLEEIVDKKFPYKDIVTDAERAEIKAMFDKGIDFLVKAQIKVNGVKAGWCAQHDPKTYAPKEAREYERPSISGSESIPIIKLLMNQPENTEAHEGAIAALEWLDAHKLVDKSFNKNGVVNKTTGETEYIYENKGSVMWYRFYDLQGRGFFSDRSSNPNYKKNNGYFYDVKEISEERRTGYSWFGNWLAKPLANYKKYGYYANRLAVKVVGTSSVGTDGSFTNGTVYYASK